MSLYDSERNGGIKGSRRLSAAWGGDFQEIHSRKKNTPRCFLEKRHEIVAGRPGAATSRHLPNARLALEMRRRGFGGLS
jgi:hypothetical protein